MKRGIFPVLVLFLAGQVYSQAYMTAGGVRLGTDWGLTVQQRIGKSMTMEGILQSSLQREEFLVTGLIEKHYPVVFRGLNIYMGGGLHKGWLSNEADPETGQVNKDPFGLTFIGGAELTFARLNISYDFKPAFNLQGGEKTFYMQSGLSVRYVLLKNKVYKDMTKKKRKKNRKKESGIGLGDIFRKD